MQTLSYRMANDDGEPPSRSSSNTNSVGTYVARPKPGYQICRGVQLYVLACGYAYAYKFKNCTCVSHCCTGNFSW